MQNENTRNTVLFVVCAAAILILYQVFVLEPNTKRRQAEAARGSVAAEGPATTAATAPGALPGPAVAPRTVYLPLDQARAASPRVAIDTPFVSGTLALRGARIDDLFLKGYRETIEPGSPNVELFRPEGSESAYFAEFGWAGANVPGLPADDTLWTLAGGQKLTPGTPVTLRYDNGAGLVFTRQIAVDDRYMFTVTDSVANRGGAPITLAPYGSVQRLGLPPGFTNNTMVHEGAVGAASKQPGGGVFVSVKSGFKGWREKGEIARESVGGWFGITDKYWLAALIPDQAARVRSAFRVTPVGTSDIYEAVYTGAPVTLAPGAQATTTARLFAGAKKVGVLDAYEETLGIPRFDTAVDWGGLEWWLTRPIFVLLNLFNGWVGNFGLAILLLTITVKTAFFPLANKSFESMSKMKKLAPKMQELKEKYPDDPARQQKELLGLYQTEKVNPLMGCLPILIQIPVWFALYKVLFVTLEMRHAPFFGWLRDLSARDPTSIFTGFGLIPWDVASTPLIGGLLNGPLHIGVLPLIYGFTMWVQQSMNPPAPDPMQQRIFQLFPIIFTFIMAPFAAGLLLYWIFSNIFTMAQQYVIMRKFKVDNPIDDFIARVRGRPKPVQAG